MYLSMLNTEQKHLFLDLELYMSKVDGDFSEEENCWYIISCLIPAKIEAKYCPKCGRKLPKKK